MDVIVVSLYHLSVYYYRELERSIHQYGAWAVKDKYDHLRREPSLLPNLPVAISPKKIVQKVRVVSSKIPSLFGKKKQSNDGNTQNGLAYAALNDSCVKQVDKSVWVVMEVDGVTPRIVTMSPKETCSCRALSTCFHIVACRTLAGVPSSGATKVNLTELRRNDRKMSEKLQAGKGHKRMILRTIQRGYVSCIE